jgi:hypothetical protein
MLLITNLNAALLSAPCSHCSCVELEAKAKAKAEVGCLPLVDIAHQIAGKLGYGEMLDEVYVTSVLIALTPQYPASTPVAPAPADGEKVITVTANSAALGKSFSAEAEAEPVRLVDLVQDQKLPGASIVTVNCWLPPPPSPSIPTSTAVVYHGSRGELARLKNLNRLAEEVLAAAGVNPTYEVAIIPPGVGAKCQNSTDSKDCAICPTTAATASDSLPLGVQIVPQSQPSISETAFSIFLGHAISHYLQAEDEDEDVWTALHIVSSLSPLMLEEWD